MLSLACACAGWFALVVVVWNGFVDCSGFGSCWLLLLLWCLRYFGAGLVSWGFLGGMV